MKVAVLGAGKMGEHVIKIMREHISSASPGERRMDRFTGEIVAYDIQEERLAEMSRVYPDIRVTRELEGVLNDPGVRLVFVTAANHVHKELTLCALAAGKAVLCEKPMANTLADARAMVEAAERRKAFLQIGFELRYSKLYTTVKDWIEAGLLGQVVNTVCYFIASAFDKSSWRCQKQYCGDMFGEKLCHYVDLPRWWIGADVVEVSSYCAPNTIPYYEIRDNYYTTYKFANGAVSHLTFMMSPAAHFEGDPLQDTIAQQRGDGHDLKYLVVGTKGAAETDVFARTIKRWEFSNTPDYLRSTLVETLTWPQREDLYYYHNNIDQTLDVIRRVEHGLPPMVAASDAYESMRVSFAAEASAESGRVIRMKNFN